MDNAAICHMTMLGDRAAGMSGTIVHEPIRLDAVFLRYILNIAQCPSIVFGPQVSTMKTGGFKAIVVNYFCRGGYQMKQFVITPAAGKSLIGKGMAMHPEIIKVLKTGTLVIIAGTTNGYVA